MNNKVASWFYSCLCCVHNVGAAEQPEQVNALPNCLTYRQIAGLGVGASSAPSKRVPVLFTTNRGLYVRVAQSSASKHEYEINFCDLERWSTKRANVVSLEDSFSLVQQPRSWNNYALYNKL
ncbi:uncharacterized protein LOC108601429 [Drosophila busckii]|uniref:uncharacterized protein LOC108601429 n=1 Tax=Drosophila busckii TaxID=30019 RepID=UPI00083EA757|nr:uncharacterized protein LOC108601429 [Drosophila busckii]